MSADITIRQNRILAQLERSGRRVTSQRQAIIAAMLAHGGHPTTMDIYDALQQQHPSISQATVYNTITMLEELGILHRLELADDEHTHYDLDTDPHVNVVCRTCGRITDVHTDTLEALMGLVSARSGYDVSREGVVVYGVCATCAG